LRPGEQPDPKSALLYRELNLRLPLFGTASPGVCLYTRGRAPSFALRKSVSECLYTGRLSSILRSSEVSLGVSLYGEVKLHFTLFGSQSRSMSLYGEGELHFALFGSQSRSMSLYGGRAPSFALRKSVPEYVSIRGVGLCFPLFGTVSPGVYLYMGGRALFPALQNSQSGSVSLYENLSRGCKARRHRVDVTRCGVTELTFQGAVSPSRDCKV